MITLEERRVLRRISDKVKKFMDYVIEAKEPRHIPLTLKEIDSALQRIVVSEQCQFYKRPLWTKDDVYNVGKLYGMLECVLLIMRNLKIRGGGHV